MRMSGPAVSELAEIDLYAPENYERGSLHPAWAALRRAAPVVRQETPEGIGFWSLTRHRDVVEALRDTECLSSECGSLLEVAGGDPAAGRTILLTDPPSHALLRVPLAKLMARHTSPDRTAEMTAAVRSLVTEYLDSDVNDFVDLATLLPHLGLGPFIGVSRDIWAEVTRWTMAGLAPEEPAYAVGDRAETHVVAHHELFTILAAHLQERRRDPRDDMFTVLDTLDFGGRRLTTPEILNNCRELIMAANATTPVVACHLMLVLAEQPHLLDFLRKNRAAIPQAVEEAIRWATPINHLMRRTRTETRISDTTIPPDSLVCLWLASANRDEEVFTRPYDFRPDRSPNQHVGFGRGRHYCIGARVARIVLTALVGTLVENFDRIELAGTPRHLRSNFVNGITHLPIRAVPITTRRSTARRAVTRRVVARRVADSRVADSQGGRPR